MKRIVTINLQIAARWFLPLSLLTGIFFSSGEGIRLLPFPVSSDHGAKQTSPFRGETGASYAFSVHNSVKSLSKNSKFQRNIKTSSACGVYYSCETDDLKYLALPVEETICEAELFYRSTFLISPTDRAPPFV